jgi:hypothetical protein
MSFIGAACAKGAFVHFALDAKRAVSGKLRRAKRTGIQAITATDTLVFVVQNDPIGSDIEAINGADFYARRVGAVHTRHANAYLLANDSLVDRYYSSAINADGNLMGFFTRDYAAVAVDTTRLVAIKFHSSHCLLLTPSRF